MRIIIRNFYLLFFFRLYLGQGEDQFADHPELPVGFTLQTMVVKEIGRRINAEYGEKPVMKKVVSTVVKQKAKVHLGKAKPRKW